MKLPVLSYTFLNTYEICPKQAFHRYVSKDAPFVGSDASRWGDKVHKAMEKRLAHPVEPLPSEMSKWEPLVKPLEALGPRAEMKLGMRRDGSPTGFFDSDVWLRGKADVVIVYDSAALLLDWKTGKRREDPKELEVQAVLLASLHSPPLEKITGRYVWLQDNALGKPHDVSNVGETLELLQDKAAEIEANHAKGYWPKKQGPLCAYCPVKSCEFNTSSRHGR